MRAPILSAVGEAARRGDEPRFLAALFAPPARREALFALLAFNLELSKIPATVSEPILGEIRLAWWREALDDLFERDIVRGHEVIAALDAARGAAALDHGALVAMVDARLYALTPGGIEDTAALGAYLGGTGGALVGSLVRALGGDAAAVEVAALAGRAEATGRLIAALPEIIANGGDAHLTAGLDMNALREGRTPAALSDALRGLAEDGLARLGAARARRREVPRAMRAPLFSVHVAERVLISATKPGFDPFGYEETSPFRARVELLARAAAGRF
ncbi:squalene/phytoene synthase family protein [Pikeienuella piscinae]|uniref:Squalene/phytoene synthase family protein n=1 Tax=Pikeienuella piscinae TaxID=2748098 RepID=A0A7L5BVS2_9RHOB|nr:squalene/phytoene synthase family protein [Pikeienuella piscinae]QIE54306.1 squalene/phytoene synthase family protein [Pikeienuella piscinae]